MLKFLFAILTWPRDNMGYVLIFELSFYPRQGEFP